MTLDDPGTYLGDCRRALCLEPCNLFWCLSSHVSQHYPFVPTIEMDIDNGWIFIVHSANKAVPSLAYFHRHWACLIMPWRHLFKLQVSSTQTQKVNFSSSGLEHRHNSYFFLCIWTNTVYIFNKHLLSTYCVSGCFRPWGYSPEQDRRDPTGGFGTVGMNVVMTVFRAQNTGGESKPKLGCGKVSQRLYGMKGVEWGMWQSWV